MTSTNVIQFAPALERRGTRYSRVTDGPWDRCYVAGIDGLWSEPPAFGMVVPFRK